MPTDFDKAEAVLDEFEQIGPFKIKGKKDKTFAFLYCEDQATADKMVNQMHRQVRHNSTLNVSYGTNVKKITLNDFNDPPKQQPQKQQPPRQQQQLPAQQSSQPPPPSPKQQQAPPQEMPPPQDYVQQQQHFAHQRAMFAQQAAHQLMQQHHFAQYPPPPAPLYLYAQQQQQQQHPWQQQWQPVNDAPLNVLHDQHRLQSFAEFTIPSSAASSEPATPASAIEQGVEATCAWIRSASLGISAQSQQQIINKVVENVVDTEALGLMSFEEFINMLGINLPAGDFVKLRKKWPERLAK